MHAYLQISDLLLNAHPKPDVPNYLHLITFYKPADHEDAPPTDADDPGLTNGHVAEDEPEQMFAIMSSKPLPCVSFFAYLFFCGEHATM